MRISSTQLNDFQLCPRRWAFSYAGGEDEGAGRAAGVGSVIHACLEHFMGEGYWPTRAEVEAMPGNYDPPSVPLARWAGVWEEAQASLALTPDPWALIPEGFQEFELEKSLEDWAIVEQGVTFGGFIDVYSVSECGKRALIFDWKTKGASAWRYRSNGAALHDNTQLLYYAACVARNTGVSEVVVGHGNLLRVEDARKAQPVDVQCTTLSLDELQAFWTLLVGDWVPSMKRAARLYADPKTRNQIPADRSACFTYGRCQHLARCNALSCLGQAPQTLSNLRNLKADPL